MKRIIVLTILLIVSAASFSQQTTPSLVLIKQDYLQKSKNQKTVGWVMLGGGATFVLLGMIGDSKSSALDDAATGLFRAGVGVLTMLGSIPLFLASGRNKRKGMSLSFKNETAPQIQKNSFVCRPIPSVNLKISL